MTGTFEKLRKYLDQKGVKYNELQHPAGESAEDYHRAVGCKWEEQGKCLLIKVKKDGQKAFYIYVLPADKKGNLDAVKNLLSVKEVKLATREELQVATGCDYGELSPLAGATGLRLIMDQSFLDQENIYMNAGDSTKSFVIKVKDLVEAEKPLILEILSNSTISHQSISDTQKPTPESGYSPADIEPKWQAVWEKEGTYRVDLTKAKNPYYNLMMFPYPSAEGLHVGNMYAFTAADVHGRFKALQGYDVFEPIGLDGFGIHSENFALKVGRRPEEHAAISEKNFYRQLHTIGCRYDWAHTLETYDPSYYKWTQWIFVQMFKAGLAYRGKSVVNFCPKCKTVLSDEQVIDGKCERCGTEVAKKEMEQWFFRITKYAQKLLDNLAKIDWSEKIKTTQENWIGRSEGINIKHKVKDLGIEFEVYDSIPQTFMAQTFIVIAPEHPLVEKLVKGTKYEKSVLDFVAKIKRKKKQKSFNIEKEKEGIFTGRYSEDYVGTGQNLPIWVAGFVIKEYGTGIVGSSAHDERDFAFAKQNNLPLKPVLFPKDKKMAEKVRKLEVFYREPDGILEEPAMFAGLRWDEARGPIINYLVKAGYAERVVNYHLRDWLISRQRYWGPPIPMIFCSQCAHEGRGEREEMPGWYCVSEAKLLVLLPKIDDYQPEGNGKGPLAKHPEFYKTTCPSGHPAVRETDVSDTFLDSAWYELRYPSVGSAEADKVPFNKALTQKWLPVDMYTGGAEHAVLHLMYFRFVTMVLHDLGYLEFDEPAKGFFAHGLLVKEGAKMSKSKGNVVTPDEYINRYGTDALRLYLMFMGPVSEGGDFRDFSMSGMRRWVDRVWRYFNAKLENPGKEDDGLLESNKLVIKATDDFPNRRYNTTISAMMIFINETINKQVGKRALKNFLVVLAPFAPHIAEEFYQRLLKVAAKSNVVHNSNTTNKPDLSNCPSSFRSIHLEPWPKVDKNLLKAEKVTVVVQVNGKTRATIEMEASKTAGKAGEKEAINRARRHPRVSKHLQGRSASKIIYLEGRLINFVVS